jgi:hypothetical protein
MGGLYTNIVFPGNINPENNVPAEISAEGCQYSYFALFAYGDAGAGSIASANKIVRISTIDHSVMSVFGISYRRYCTIVTGELTK